MKKFMGLLLGSALLFTACKKNDIAPSDDSLADDVTAVAATQRQCASDDVYQQQIKNNPALRQRMEAIEAFTNRFTQDRGQSARLLSNGIIEIPVVFNVIYRTASENISLAQLQSQVDVLNEDFAALNADYNNTPATFTGVRSGDVGVRFVLDQVIRLASTKRSWSPNDAMKSASTGGINATSPTTKLNIWVVNRMVQGGQTILGYAQFPGGPAATDGVVLGYNFTGRVGTLSAPFNKGRTGTHEVGHWLNLRHIWGDATCGNDLVGDTPPHNTANYGCPAAGHRSTCSGTPIEMTMNYMDYTDDACMYMFSTGQRTRMLAIFAAGGPRNSFAQP
jgi:Pregnancy-associated plasma protein-A